MSLLATMPRSIAATVTPRMSELRRSMGGRSGPERLLYAFARVGLDPISLRVVALLVRERVIVSGELMSHNPKEQHAA